MPKTRSTRRKPSPTPPQVHRQATDEVRGRWATLKRYHWNLWISFDQFLATAFLGGAPDETISSRLGKLKRRYKGTIPWRVAFGLPRLLDEALDLIDPGHSIDAIEDDEGSDAVRRQ